MLSATYVQNKEETIQNLNYDLQKIEFGSATYNVTLQLKNEYKCQKEGKKIELFHKTNPNELQFFYIKIKFPIFFRFSFLVARSIS